MKKETGDYGRGFSRWVNPKMDNYFMACCDCGLVHEMQFRAFKRGKVRKDGSYLLEVLKPSQYGVRFRARRAEAYTRRERKKERLMMLNKLALDTGKGCSVCGQTPVVNVEGTYWLCGPCVAERLLPA